MKTKITEIENLPQVITAQQIADYLNISRKKVYDLFGASPTDGGIPNFNIGASRRVVKEDFVQWMADRKRVQEKVIYGRFGNLTGGKKSG